MRLKYLDKMYRYYYKIQIIYGITTAHFRTADIIRGQSLEPKAMLAEGVNFSKIQNTDQGYVEVG